MGIINCILAKRVVKTDNPLPNGILAQLGEHLPYKQRVIGSSPIGPISLHIFSMKNLKRKIAENSLEIIILSLWRDSSAD